MATTLDIRLRKVSKIYREGVSGLGCSLLTHTLVCRNREALIQCLYFRRFSTVYTVNGLGDNIGH